MLKIYGTHLCPDCVEAREKLDALRTAYEFVELTESTANLKEFLKIRDQSPLFDEARKEGLIGIPCFIKEDGSMTLSLADIAP